jgi:hypothetical protein
MRSLLMSLSLGPMKDGGRSTVAWKISLIHQDECAKASHRAGISYNEHHILVISAGCLSTYLAKLVSVVGLLPWG